MKNLPIKPIKTKEDYNAALEEIYSLMSAEPGTPEGDRVEILSVLVEMYEDKKFPIDTPDPIAAIKYRMEESNLTVTDLGEIIGYKSRASEILKYKRKLTLAMIRKISTALKIPAEILVQPY